MPGNLFRVYLSDLVRREKTAGRRVGIFQNRFYGLPYESFDQCLNFICSYSGNTEETIAAFEEAIEHQLPCVGFSSGGKSNHYVESMVFLHVDMPIPVEGFQPRMGTGYFIGAMYQVLVNQGMVPDTTDEMLRLAASLKMKLSNTKQRVRLSRRSLLVRHP